VISGFRRAVDEQRAFLGITPRVAVNCYDVPGQNVFPIPSSQQFP
jgi:hypothetical protein